MRIPRKLYTGLTILLLGTILANSTLLGPAMLQANFSPIEENSNKSIIILADSDLLAGGLESQVNRYARDIEINANGADIKIVSVGFDEEPALIAAALKNQYYQEALEGIVVIGDVPLPVVDKGGNRFISIYPYTDFDQAAYVWNQDNNFFERNLRITDFEPEIWHGIIQFEALEQYQAFFEKNHKYYQGDAEYADFEEKIFYMNPDFEAKSLNSSLLRSYENYSAYASESAFNRYSNKLLANLASDFGANIDASLGTGSYAGDFSDLASSFLQVPDIQTKLMIDKYMSPVTAIFEKASTQERSALLGTGRYQSDDYYTPITLIANKDEFYKQYFWEQSIEFEEKIDQIVTAEQAYLEIYNGAELQGEITLKSGDTVSITPQLFVNNSYDFKLDLDLGSEALRNKNDIAVADLRNSVSESVDSPDDCVLYRGGSLGGDLAKSVEMWRKDYVQYPGTEDESKICLGLDGDADSTYRCSLFYGVNIRDNEHSKVVEDAYKGQFTHEACFNMRPLSMFESLRSAFNPSTLHPDQTNHPEDLDLELANARVNSADIILAGDLTLADFLEKLPNYKSDPQDWNAWSSYLLANPYQRTFTVENPFGAESNIQTIKLEVEPISKSILSGALPIPDPNPPKIPSVLEHKDPSPALIRKAIEDKQLQQLPIDQVRYTSFVDKKGNKQEVVYPNLFEFNSWGELHEYLVGLEEQLSSLSEISYLGHLTSQIEQAEMKATLEDLYTWKSLSLDQKYTKISQTILDSSQENHLDIVPANYEIAVIDSRADQDSLVYELIGESTFGLDETQIFSPEDLSYQSEMQSQVEAETELEREASRALVETYPLGQWLTEYIPNWFEEVQDVASSVYPADPGSFLSLPGYEDLIISKNTDLESISLSTNSQDFSLESGQVIELDIVAKNSDSKPIVGDAFILDLSIEGELSYSESLDDDPDTEGLQIFMGSGQETLEFQPSQVGAIKFKLSLGEVSQEIQVMVHQSLSTQIELATNRIPVADTNGLEFSIFTLDESGNKVLIPRPNLSLDNPNLGSFVSLTETNQATEFKYKFKPKNKAGRVNLNVENLFATNTIQEIVIEPGPAKKLDFTQTETQVNTQSAERFTVDIQALDQYGNLVKNANNPLELSVSDPSKITLISSGITLDNGKASIQLESVPEAFGSTFLKAESAGLETSIHKLSLGSKLNNSNLEAMDFSALYLELLTPTSALNSLGYNLLSKGKTQAISTLSTDLESSAPLFYLHPNGSIEVLDSKLVQTSLSYGENEIQLKAYDQGQHELARVRVNTEGLTYQGITQNKLAITEAGIYLENLSQASEEDLIALLNFTEGGVVETIDSSYTLEPYSNSSYFTLSLLEAGQEVARLIYAFDRGDAVSLSPASHPEIKYERVASLNSTNAAQGYKFYNPSQPLSADQLPSSSELRFEDNLEADADLLGLREGHKAVLLLAAGQSIGEANQPYLSEAGLVLGDPMIKLAPTENYSVTSQFSYDIGEYLGRLDSPVTALLDQEDYVVLADEQGNLSRLTKGSKSLDKNFAFIPNGIQDIQAFDEGLIILTKEACVQEDSCVYLLSETGELKQVKLNLEDKIVQIFPQDFTGDGDTDLAVLTNKKQIFMFLQTNEGMQSEGAYVASTTSQLDSAQNLVSQLWLESTATTAVGLNVNTTEGTQLLKFSPLTTNQWSGSSLVVRDLNAGNLNDGDILEYALFLKNNSAQSFTGSLSLPIPKNYEYIDNSLATAYTLSQTDNQLRAYVIDGLNLSDGANTALTFQFRYRLSGNETQALINIVTDAEGYPADGLVDFQLQIPNTDFTTYYYSNYDEEANRLTYRKYERSLGETTVPEETLKQFSQSEDTNSQVEELDNSLLLDSDGDGIPDIYDTGVETLDDIGDKLEDFIQENSCEGKGCLAIPHNEAFLVPRGTTPGIPVFGWGCPNPVGVAPGPAANTCAGGRFYLSPTLTGELAGSVCIGPRVTGICYTSRIGNLGSLCEDINDGVQAILNGATDFVGDLGGGFINVSGEEPAETGVNIQLPGFPDVITNWASEQIEEIQRSLLDLPDITLIYPDIQDLVDLDSNAQEIGFDDLESILASLNAMPLFNVSTKTHYLQYPQIEPGELSKYKAQLAEVWDANMQEINRVLNTWGCYGERVESDADFVANLKKGDIRLGGAVGNACISLASTTLSIQASFDANIEALNLYRDLPENIFKAENFLAKYANGLIGYADAILENTATYISTNRAILEAWEQLFEDMNSLVADFEVILDVFISYQDSCSTCRNTSSEDGWINLMTGVFAGMIPPLPVIQVPKWPNFTVDVSQVEANIDITLPKFEFKPEKIILPDLNGFQLSLPEVQPSNFNLELPDYNLELFPTLPPPPDLGEYLLELPDLPEIQIPELPTLPAPPEVNLEDIGGGIMQEIDGSLEILDKVLRIVCLVKKGILPLPESQIKGHIESLTARPLDVVLPIDIQAGFETPEITTRYLEEYRVILETHFSLDLNFLDKFAEGLSTKFNSFETKLSENVVESAQGIIDSAPDTLDLSGEREESAFNYNEGNIAALSNSISKLQTEFNKLDTQLPDTINLVATNKTIPRPESTDINLDRAFALTPQFAKTVNNLLAYAEEPISFSESRVLVADNSDLPKLSSPNSIATSTYKLAQADSPSSGTADLDFNPSSGLYYYNSETGLSENILANQGESEKSRQILSTDLDLDIDQDLIYTKDQEIYFKAKLTDSPRIRTNSNIEKLDFSEIDIKSTTSVEYQGLSLEFAHNQVQIDFLNKPKEAILIDVYQSSFTQELPYKRFLLEDSTENSNFSELDRVPLSENYNLRKQDFETINYKKLASNSLSLDLDNQTYVAVVKFFNPLQDEFEILEPRLALSPNICGDKSGPEINLEGGEEIEVSVANPIDIDLSGSSDYQTAISEVYLDLDLEEDSDYDGNPINDRDLQGSGENLASTNFRLNPINETKDFQIAVWVIDLAGNSSYQILTIHVKAPDIILESISPSLVSGYLDPIDDNVPLTLVRQRDGVLKQLKDTQSNSEGEFQFTGFQETDNLQILDQEQNVLFLINRKTGSIQAKSSAANFKVKAAVYGHSPNLIELYNANNLVTKLLRVADPNYDVEIMTAKPDNNYLNSKDGVTVVNKSRIDKYKVEAIPGDDSQYPGGAAITKDSQRQAIIDTDGSIYLIDQNLKLELSELDDLSELQWINILDGNKEIAYVYISPSQNELEIGLPNYQAKQVNEALETTVPATTEESPIEASPDLFTDISPSDPDYEVFNYLNSLGVLNGINRDGLLYLEPDRLLTRAEYAKIILRIMCIEPSEEAYQSPAVFWDIPYQDNLPWYYAETKETKLQGLFEGYKGERNDNGLTPFKPGNSITRAEALKVILEALELKGVVDLSSLVESSPWYLPYINLSQNISAIVVAADYAGTDSLITPDQAQVPTMNVSRREFARLAYATLLVNNCLLEDTDQDGIPYHYEVENGLDPAQDDSQGDNDGDGVSNFDEYQEVPSPSVINLARPGLFIQEITCTTCPCLYRLEEETDIIPGDILFVLLKKPGTQIILRRSNLLTY